MPFTLCCNKCLRGSDSFLVDGGDKLQFCAGCKAVAYCDEACQRADWTEHKPMCAGLKRLRAEAVAGAGGQNKESGTKIMIDDVKKLFTSTPGNAPRGVLIR